MAEYQDVMKQWHRMCKEHCGSCTDGVSECLLNKSGICSKPINRWTDKDISEAEAIIIRWAEANPEPVYPMWCEWLADKGVVDVARMPVDYSGGIVTEIKPSGKMYEHIPADIAEKIGLKPKEGA